MIWISNINLADVFTIISSTAVVIGLIIGLYQWSKEQKMKRMQCIKEIALSFYQNKEIAETFYMFDYQEDFYSYEFSNDYVLQRKVDNLLTILSYLCYLRMKKIITAKEFEFVEYKVVRTLNSKGVKEYIYNLYHWAGPKMSFYWLIKYGEKYCNVFDAEFYNPKSEGYPHNLNINY